MFKNPLKYQKGGSTPTQEQQQVLAAFIEWLPKRVKEFQGMRPEEIAQTLDGMSRTPEGQKQVQQLMQQFQQEVQSSQSFRQGGKIHDFICKHAKGGKVSGCGCKQKGGTFKSNDKQVTIKDFGTAKADTTGTYSYPSTNGEFQFNPMGRTATVWGNTGGWPIHRYADQNWINRHPRKQMLPGFLGGHKQLAPEGFFENLIERVNNRVPSKKQEGGNIEKAQDGKVVYYPAKNQKYLNEVQVETMYAPDFNMSLMSEPSKVGERRDSMFVFNSIPYSSNNTLNATRNYSKLNKFTDGPLYLKDNATSRFERLRNLWEQSKIKAEKRNL